jgi:hypothetical protein
MRIWEAERQSRVLQVLLGLVGFGVLALGAVWGFPVQDDGYVFRLLRAGGPRAFVDQHADRPLIGFVLAEIVRLFGEHKFLYIMMGLLAWSLFAAETAALWKRLYPEFRSLWPVAAFASVSPVLAHVQFSPVVTVYGLLVPVELVLAAVIVALSRRDRLATIAALFLAATAAAVSEYGVATSLAAAAFFLVRREKRSAGTIFIGAVAGYAVYRAMSDVAARKVTNPSLQWSRWIERPVDPIPRIVAAVWDSVVGVWGRAAGGVELDWSSKSSLIGAALALVVALAVVRLGRVPAVPDGEPPPPASRSPLGPLLAAVVAGLVPVVAIRGWPLRGQYTTRYLLSVSAFACCATIGILTLVVRRRYLPIAAALLSFLAADQLVKGAWEERRLSIQLARTSDVLRPSVHRIDGLTVLVEGRWPDRNVQELIGRMTHRWNGDDARRLWIERPDTALDLFGPRMGCRDLTALAINPTNIKWPPPDPRIAQLLFDASADAPDFQPYYSDCPPARQP